MHIAFLTPEYPHPKVICSAGIGTSIKNLAVALVQQNIKVTLFIYGQLVNEVFEEDAIRYHLIADKKYNFLKWFFYRKHIQYYINIVVKKENINLIEAPDWTGITAFMRFTIPLVIRFHGSDTYFCYLEERKQKIKNYWFEKLAVCNAKACIAPTDFAGKISGKLLGVPKKKIKTIYNGIDLKSFKNERPNVYTKGMILFIGTIIRKKGVFELPEIFNNVRQQCPNAQLVLIGSDAPDIYTSSKSTWQLLKIQFKEEDARQLKYLGKIQYQEVQEYIKNASVCVFPSFAETFGMVTIEAMAMQKPVVNSNISWALELIDDGVSGFLSHPKIHDLYAQKIINLLKDDQLCAKIGKNARIQVEKFFDIEKIATINL